MFRLILAVFPVLTVFNVFLEGSGAVIKKFVCCCHGPYVVTYKSCVHHVHWPA